MYYLGFDIGGSFVKAVLVKNKKIVRSAIQALPDNLGDLLGLVAKMKDELTTGRDEIGGIGFSVAGTLDVKRTNMLKSYNISYLDNQSLKKILEEKMAPCPVKIEQDVYSFLIAEKEIGLAKNLKDFFYLTIGTGIGAACMIGGKIYIGAHGGAGEAAHMIMDIKEGLDFEQLASNKFIARELGIGAEDAKKNADSGDEKAIEAFKALGKNLGIGIANIINILDLEAVIISGGIAQAKELILPGINEGIDKFVISPAAKQTQILFSELGRFGGALGAALMFNHKFS